MNKCFIDAEDKLLLVEFWFQGGSAGIPSHVDQEDLAKTFEDGVYLAVEKDKSTEGGHVPDPQSGEDFGTLDFHHGEAGIHSWTMPCKGTWPFVTDEGEIVDLKVVQPRWGDVGWVLFGLNYLIEDRNQPEHNRGIAEFSEYVGPSLHELQDLSQLDTLHDAHQMGTVAWQNRAFPFDHAGLLPPTGVDCYEEHGSTTSMSIAINKRRS